MKQHYVPQLILRNFTANRREQLFVYDKHLSRAYPSSVRDVAAERDFYEFELDGRKASLEAALANLETRAGLTVGSLLRDRRTTQLGLEEKQWFGMFAAAQMLRTRRQQEMSLELNQSLRDAIIKLGGNPAKATMQAGDFATPFQDMTSEHARVEAMRFLIDFVPDCAQLFCEKLWVLFETSIDNPFVIGDSPVTMQNTLNQHSFKSTLGLRVPGIEIYLPLSATVCIGFLCPTIKTFFDATLAARPNALSVPNIREFMEHLAGLKPLTMTEQSTMRFNALQIANASRFVYSGRDDFELVKEMLIEDPRIRSGVKFETAGRP